jgi:hypothetical protein
MGKLIARTAAIGIATAVLLLAGVPGSWAQEALTAKLDPSGQIQFARGEVQLATIELNAHGAEWKHAPQTTATAQVSALPNGAGKRFTGTLPVPNTDGGAILYTETIRPLPQGLRLEYDLGVTKAMKLNGLQLSVNLPVAQYAGKPVTVGQFAGEPGGATFPKDQAEQVVQVFSGEGSRVVVAKDTEDAITLELRAPTDVVIQDLRRWEQPIFEIRFPAILEDPGRDVPADEKFHLDLTVTFATAAKLVGP